MVNLTPNLTDPDGFYNELIQAHDGMSKEQSDAFNARLILTLANHIGDRQVLTAAIEAAKMSVAVLWDYPKSSASYRVRIALNLAGIDYRVETVDLLEKANLSADHLNRNPQGFVPVLDIDGYRLTQSLAILDYLDTTRDLGLLPREPLARARQTALAHAIAVDLHPVCNLSVASYATNGVEPARTEWMQHFIAPRMAAFEAMLGGFTQAPYCCGTAPTLADVVLMPQIYNAVRWGADYAGCPRIVTAAEACAKHPAFASAHPDHLPPKKKH